MTGREDVIRFLDRLLEPDGFKDACPNGMQVYGREQVHAVATCASVSEEFFRRAREQRADFLLVHHGLFWDGSSRVVDPILARRLRVLLENEMNLAAFHLPLDAHPRLGNNACLARELGLDGLDFGFGRYKGTPIGCRGDLPRPAPLEEVTGRLAASLRCKPVVLDAGKPVSRVGVVSGGAGDIPFLLEALEAECDTYLTGVIFEQATAIAREAGINMIALGHYNSEKLGVQALGDALGAEFPVEVIHMDVPNPV